MNARIDAVSERLDRIASGPDAIESQLFFRVARPLFALTKWRASLETTALTRVVAHLNAPDRDWAALRPLIERAEAELEANVGALERVTIIRKEAPVAHAMWLRRVAGVLALAAAAADLTLVGEASDPVVRAATRTDPCAILPPLVPLRAGRGGEEIEDSRLVDLELASIDHLIAAARAETALLGRKRRLLFAARQRLLETSAALPLGRSGVRDRTSWLAREISRIDRLQAAGLSPDVSLVHQARQALARRDPARLFAAISALDANAIAIADRDIAALTGPALDRLGSHDAVGSLDRSTRDLLGSSVDTVNDAVADARSDALARLGMGGVPSDRVAAKSFLEHLPADAGVAVLRAAALADGFFEVGGALAPIRVEGDHRVPRLVKHPTKDLVLLPAEDVNDVRDALIGDPRTILLDLAIGRLFARRFVREVVERRSRIVMHGEVRVYVLDGSGSMKGARARVRDAILVAELATLSRRLEDVRGTRCTLYYRYFNEAVGPVTRVASAKAAKDAIRTVVTDQREGGTDIEAALLASLAQIAESRASDPDLARAQIVLVTDGIAPVDEARIVAAHDALAGLPIGVSVIALGDENPALRALVARQRAKGEAAFYHYLDDAELGAITAGQLAGDAVHPPESWTTLAADPRALEAELGGLLDDLEAIDRRRDVDALERIEEETQARRDVGLTEEETRNEGDLARVEALRKDRVALGARFARWFPAASACRASELPEPGSPARDDIEATACALASVAEVVALLGGSTAARQADAIDLLERLLPDARLTPATYRAVLRDHPAAVAPSLRALHDAAAPTP